MSGFGSFTPEAYEQLRNAYASELQLAGEAEEAGIEINGETMGVETVPVTNPWSNRIGTWQYPTGHGQFMDVKQKQQDLLAILRNDNGEIVLGGDEEDEVSLDDMSDQEIDAMVDDILNNLDDDDDDEDDNLSDQEIDATIDDLSDEEFDKYIDDLVKDIEPDLNSVSDQIADLKAELVELTDEPIEELENDESD